MKQYFINLGTILSQLLNTVLFVGNPDQAVSARSYANKDKSKFWKVMYYVIETLFYPFDKGWHCYKSHQKDIKNAKKVIEKYSDI